MTEDRFNVVVFDHEGYYSYAERNVDAKTAAIRAGLWVACAEKNLDVASEIDRVIITDEDDFTNFEWRRGRGVVFPPPGEGPSG